MENPDKRLSEFVGLVKSWIPRRTPEAVNLSRDFWMPDDSCRVCYECDSQFTVFNRRHHCRLCGRVFCAKCTANSIPALSDEQKREEGDRIRVCNYCFRQRQHPLGALEHEAEVTTPVLSPSLSTASLGSTKSSCTANSSTSTVGSVSHSTGTNPRVSFGNPTCQSLSMHVKSCCEKEDNVNSERNMDSVVNMGDHPTYSRLDFCRNRCDDDEDEYGRFRSDSELQQFQHSSNYYGSIEYNDTAYDHGANKEHPSLDRIDEDIGIPAGNTTEFHASLGVNKETEEGLPNSSYECDVSSSMYMNTAYSDSVDFENNWELWIPPGPEDEEDEKEPVLFDDDDDDVGATGEWGYLRSSNSFGSGECRHKDKSSEEQRIAMKSFVDGHFRALVAQLLQAEKLPIREDDESWLRIITSLSWKAATLLKPDTSTSGGMDPGGYVKVKCIASGHRSESMVVKGVVCKKNVAHRRMRSRVEKPRVLILGGALEYHRLPNSLSCIDTLIQQEMDHLKMAVAKIDAHHPNVLLVEKSVSRYAQDYLLAKNISLVLNIKRPLLERIARCTGAQIVPSIDHLSSPKLGHCDLFHVEKFLEEHGSSGKGGKKMLKTLMFFEGCPKPFGCTVLLKGASGDELKKVKHVVQYGIFAAYHLALETSFLADEGATLPELPLKSPITVALPDKPSSGDRSISTIPGFTVPVVSKQHSRGVAQRTYMPSNSENVEVPPSHTDLSFRNLDTASVNYTSFDTGDCSLTKRIWDEYSGQPQHRIFFTSPYVQSKALHPPFDNSFKYVLMEDNSVCIPNSYNGEALRSSAQNYVEATAGSASCCDNLEMLDGSNVLVDLRTKTKHTDLWISYQDNNHMDGFLFSMEEFPPSPSEHQSILVSLSTRCVQKGTVCERAHLFRIKYYGNFDKPLGRFLRDYLLDQTYRCRSCEMPSEAHVRCYTHHQGSLTISVRKIPDKTLPGERDGKIWMWHRCLLCPQVDGLPPATKRVVMSDAAWGLSLGKFLELSFSNHAAASRVASCGHSLHRDCLRFYGFGQMVACFRYAPINVHSVYLPPSKLDFNCQFQEWIQKEADEVAHKGELLFSEVLHALCQIRESRNGSPDSTIKVADSKCQILELEGIVQKEKSEFEEAIQRIRQYEAKKGQPVIDILQINKLRRQLLFQAYLWDQRLILASSPDNRPHEVLCNIMMKNKKIVSLEKLVELNPAPKPLSRSDNLDVSHFVPRHEVSKEGSHSEEVITNQSNSEQIKDSAQESYHSKQQKTLLSSSSDAAEQLDPLESDLAVRRVLSEGHFPNAANLSETLDAKWTGDDGPMIADAGVRNSARVIEAMSSVLSVSDRGHEGKEKQYGSKSLGIVPPIRLTDIEDFSSSVLPFQSFYRCINKNWSSIMRVDTLNEYNPVNIPSFSELIRQNGARLLLPMGVNDTVIPIYDDEPTSIISYALVSPDYHHQMSNEREKSRDNLEFSISLPSSESASFYSSQSADDTSSDSFRSFGSFDDSVLLTPGSKALQILDPVACTKPMHIQISFADEGPFGKVKYSVTFYYAKPFEALRKTCCPSELDFIRSLSRCKKWGAQGGKSNVFFAKSLDDRFIIKQVTKTELESFIKFAPEYFKYLTESIATGSPTCLAKILGIYQVATKHSKGGKETKMDVLVMENLLFGRNVTRLYDLKGSSRSRYNPDSSGNNKVLLDQNLIEAIPTSPIFVGNKAKRLLERAVWNDTSFLASMDVMDYSLLVGVDEEKHELVLGIIDFMRQYTWDKHLESWVKTSGILGGPKNASPTVISPMQYKKRFRKAMSAYFYMVPDQWPPPTLLPSKSQTNLKEDNPPDGSLFS